MTTQKRAMSALDTQIASVEAALENNLKLKALRGKVEELLDQTFPSDGCDDGYDHVDDAMAFFMMGVEDVLLEGIQWRGSEDDVHPDERKEFFLDLGCPWDIAYNRSQEEAPVLDELISEAPDEMDRPATEKELRAFFSEMSEMLKGDGDE